MVKDLQYNIYLHDFRRWPIDEQMKQRIIDGKTARIQTVNPKLVSWIEKLLQTPLDDYRKFVIWRILFPYLINIRKYSTEEAYNTIRNWLDKCSQLRRVQFNLNYMVKYDINSAKRNGYLPISLEKLKTENAHLHNMLAKS